MLSKPLITEENWPGRGLNLGLPNDTPALYPLLHELMLISNFKFKTVSDTVEGITNEMANYITMSLDPNAANLNKLMTVQIASHAKRMQELEVELVPISRISISAEKFSDTVCLLE
jgi:hypothetical protein